MTIFLTVLFMLAVLIGLIAFFGWPALWVWLGCAAVSSVALAFVACAEGKRWR